ncbi:uncharacterized protein C8Q71DRAFT_109189 [Rhodofomes roseus]|uniref:Uncharacterized protein n=1 Tax=Rhodofomes roseus TaxID=34475 RepID=A0ABQ8KDM8_9APHY|nr:uncharacterized protein C8Q71DRAFT_109189 [Rhodofomes roseus]KAH9835219.1 hypothetical protein C8Q71DRAFT_109189 [Rhodofomes roseus]
MLFYALRTVLGPELLHHRPGHRSLPVLLGCQRCSITWLCGGNHTQCMASWQWHAVGKRSMLCGGAFTRLPLCSADSPIKYRMSGVRHLEDDMPCTFCLVEVATARDLSPLYLSLVYLRVRSGITAAVGVWWTSRLAGFLLQPPRSCQPHLRIGRATAVPACVPVDSLNMLHNVISVWKGAPSSNGVPILRALTHLGPATESRTQYAIP